MTKTTEYRDLAIYRTGRGIKLDDLAREQAIINRENDTEMGEDLAAEINVASFLNRGERNFFKNQYRRHVANIARGNPFYN